MKKTYITLSIITILSIIVMCMSILVAQHIGIWWVLAITIPTTVILLVFTVIVYIKNVKFECPNCKTVFTTSSSNILWAIHTTNKRFLKCPSCQKKYWCKDKFD